MKTPYNKKLKHFARKLRKFGTKGEAILWRDVLKARQMKGTQFNRQFPIDNYIVDFVARKLNLIIEIDGNSHVGKPKEDYERQKHLESLGFQFLRFSEAQVLYRIDDVVAEIDYAIECIEEELK
jgi:very-short-patch-repair endonuclease